MRTDRSHARHSRAEMDEFNQVEFCGVGGEVFDDLAADRENFAAGWPRKVGERAAVMGEIGPHVGGPRTPTLAGPHPADIQRALQHNGFDLVFRQRLGRSQAAGAGSYDCHFRHRTYLARPAEPEHVNGRAELIRARSVFRSPGAGLEFSQPCATRVSGFVACQSSSSIAAKRA